MFSITQEGASLMQKQSSLLFSHSSFDQVYEQAESREAGEVPKAEERYCAGDVTHIQGM